MSSKAINQSFIHHQDFNFRLIRFRRFFSIALTALEYILRVHLIFYKVLILKAEELKNKFFVKSQVCDFFIISQYGIIRYKKWQCLFQMLPFQLFVQPSKSKVKSPRSQQQVVLKTRKKSHATLSVFSKSIHFY